MKMFFGLVWSKMKQTLKIATLFATPAVIPNIGREFTEDELQLFLIDIPMKEDIEEGASNHQSKDYYLFDNFPKELGEIHKFCKQQIEWYMKEINGVDTDLASLRITQSWLNKTKSGESHHPHIHTNSYLSGVLYISCLPNDSINFENRMHGLYNNMEFPTPKYTDWNANIVQVNVTEGDLIIFPSWVQHYVDVNNTDKERISLSFNTFPVGEFGEYDGTTHLKL